jgi:hypothetical protein
MNKIKGFNVECEIPEGYYDNLMIYGSTYVVSGLDKEPLYCDLQSKTWKTINISFDRSDDDDN